MLLQEANVIYGTGVDIVQTSRIAATLNRQGERFVQRILGEQERMEYQQRCAHVDARGLHYLCNRYAAKEAFSKALGLGMRAPVSWHAIQIINDDNGAPIAMFSGELAKYMQDHQLTAKVTLSDEIEYSVAFVLVEKNHV